MRPKMPPLMHGYISYPKPPVATNPEKRPEWKEKRKSRKREVGFIQQGALRYQPYIAYRKMSMIGTMTHRPLGNRLDLRPHILLQLIRTLRIRRRLIIILAAIIKHQLRIADEILRRGIQILFMLFLHGAQIHGLFDDLVVVGHLVAVDGLREGPG